ncbi:F-box protein At3g28330-like isoform X2 [Eutrema salsugineum]|uniref:F-box protein At3g28330-like isoform X2 n=1 Tax=Eutrema salsugineum TaxID=72664 RepID=UPI000CED5F64|nr:F-box protein At3g28330-like isoform X2 [Eutrema salsugineum]
MQASFFLPLTFFWLTGHRIYLMALADFLVLFFGVSVFERYLLVMVASSATTSIFFPEPSASLDPNGNDIWDGIKRHRKKTKETDMDLPEEIVMNIMARLRPQSVVRFKLVCREWKSLTESAFFRDLYHINFRSTSCSNWSILHGDHRSVHSSLEEVKLDLPQEEDMMMMIRNYIGNPVLPQWIQLPPPSRDCGFYDSGLVTRMHNGALLGYKVVRIHIDALKLGYFLTWKIEIFSSDTGEWSVKQVSCPGHGVSMVNISNPVSLDGKLHWLDNSRRIIVHDFFSHDDEVRAIYLPTRMQGTRWLPPESPCGIGFCPSPCGRMICTTSQGYFVLIDVGLIEEVKSYNVRVWRLKCDSWSWEKAWEINMACLGLGRYCVPMAVNYFDIDIIYLWDLDRKCFLACNLRTNEKSYGTHKDGVFKHRTSNPFSKDCVVYKEDTFCFEPRSCLSQFVPSLQVVPTYIGTQDDNICRI